MQTLLGLDIGTQGTKAVLFSADGACLASAFVASALLRPAPGVVEEDPEQQYAAVCEAIAACLRQGSVATKSVAGLAIAGQMAGILGVGKDGRHVTLYDSWLDTRCAPYIARLQAEAGTAVLESTGCAPSFNHGPKMLWWQHERPEVFRTIRAFVQPGGYTAMRLCGLTAERAFIDATYLHFTGFADNRNLLWNEALCAQVGVPLALLPRIVAPSEVVGEVTPEAAARCGLVPGTPVIAGCGDTAASFLACGATAEGICVDVAGTASVFAATTTVFTPDHAHGMLACGRSATPGLWHAYAYINGGGLNLEWFRREIAGRGRDEAALSYETLNEMAEGLAPAEGDPLFVPHLGGRVCPSQPRLRGAWVGLTWEHTLGHLYRAALEGVALEYGLYQRALRSLYPNLPMSELRVTGGGEKSAVWNRLKADVLGMPVVGVAGSEGAPMGAALLAGVGAGVLPDLATAADRWVQVGPRAEPDHRQAERYQRRLTRYATLLAALDEIQPTKESSP